MENSISVFDKIYTLMQTWRIEHRGEMPNRIFLGNKEIYEVEASTKHIVTDELKQTIFGVQIERVYQTSYLSLGDVIEYEKN